MQIEIDSAAEDQGLSDWESGDPCPAHQLAWCWECLPGGGVDLPAWPE